MKETCGVTMNHFSGNKRQARGATESVNVVLGSPARKCDIMAQGGGTTLVSLSHTRRIMIQRCCYNEKNEEKCLFSTKMIEKQKVTGGEVSDETIKKQKGN